jgi:hypothetical protein
MTWKDNYAVKTYMSFSCKKLKKKYFFELGGWDAALPLLNKYVWQDKSSILIDSVSYKTANNYACSYTRKNWAILWCFWFICR